MAEPAPDRPHGRELPLPALLFALLGFVLIGWPLLRAPALLDEIPFLSGQTQIAGWLPGVAWLDAEMDLLGDRLLAHRLVGLLAGLAVFAAVVAAAGEGARSRSLGVLLCFALLVHPAHQETLVRLGHRPVLVSELLLAAGLFGARWGRGLATGAGAGGLLGGGALGLPGAALLLAPVPGCGRMHSVRRGWLVAGGLLAGAVASLVFLARPGSWIGGSAAATVLLAPWRVGMIQPAPAWGWVLGALALAGVLVALAPRGERRIVLLAVIGAVLAAVLAPWLRPERTDLDALRGELTPEVFLPSLALVLFAALRVARGGGLRLVPALVLVLLSVGTGWRHARLFESETRLLDHAVAVAPASLPLHLLRGEAFLREIPMDESSDPDPWAREALQSANYALRTHGEDPSARLLRALALLFLHKIEESRQEIDRILARDPSAGLALLARAQLEMMVQNWSEAVRWARAASSSDRPRLGALRYRQLLAICEQRIRSALEARDATGALQLCEELLEIAPEELWIAEAEAHAHVVAGDLEEAIARFRRLAEERRSEVAMGALVGLLDQLGRQDEARYWRQQLLRMAAEPRGGR